MLIYAWWIMSFEIAAILYGAYVVLKAPGKKVGAAAILAVLTTTTFLFCHELYTGE